MKSISSPWPFDRWGIDLVGPFTPGKGQVKFLVVAVDYFTKWVEAQPLAKVTAKKMTEFLQRNILCRYGRRSLSLIMDLSSWQRNFKVGAPRGV